MAEPSTVFSYALSGAKRRDRNVKKEKPAATAEWLEIDFLKRQRPEGLSKALRDAERETVAPLIFRIRTKQCVRSTGAIPIANGRIHGFIRHGLVGTKPEQSMRSCG